MADSGAGGAAAISLQQASDDDSMHSPRSVPTLSGGASGGGGGGCSSSGHKNMVSPLGDIIISNSKKPRGRPPGSKNKPKPPIVITKDSGSAMKAVVLEISAGSDVVETIVQYARRRQVGISVLSGSGAVLNVKLRHPAGPHEPSLSLQGPFNLLSLSGSYIDSFPAVIACSSSPSAAGGGGGSAVVPMSGTYSLLACSSFTICLAGAQGHVFGGIVAGKVVAASTVMVVAATFLDPTLQRLPLPVEGGAEYEGEEDTKPCINEKSCHTYGGGGGGRSSGVASPTCQMNTSPPDHYHQVMAWGPPSRTPY
ncbi:hypothetical protein FF1_030206 [Malus domestica]